ncbi:MAG TPA: glycosyltransferase [Isosphaeraceae bacterium]|jgi:glycosyltransferase involved in cell wall biosynthesis
MNAPSGSGAVVCQVLHSLGVGGAEVLAVRLARRLGGSFRFVFACLDERGPLGDQLAGEGLAVHVLGRRPGVDGRCLRRLGGLLRREGVGLVHAHQYTPFFYAAAARLGAARPPIAFTEHGRTFPDYRRPKRVVANRLLLRWRDRVVGVGHDVRRALVEHEGIPPGRVEVIYNGIDMAPIAPADDPEARDRARRELGVGPEDFVAIQVARLDPVKDHPLALRALARVVARRPEARLVVVGEGPEAETIRGEVRRLGLDGAVRLLGLRGDVPALLAGANLGLLTSRSEGIPLTVIEAMAAGLPVLATRVGGLGEVVADGQTGLLVPPGDDGALADAWLRLADDPDLRRQMGAQGRRRAVADFSEGRMVEGYRRLYQEMLRG